MKHINFNLKMINNKNLFMRKPRFHACHIYCFIAYKNYEINMYDVDILSYYFSKQFINLAQN